MLKDRDWLRWYIATIATLLFFMLARGLYVQDGNTKTTAEIRRLAEAEYRLRAESFNRASERAKLLSTRLDLLEKKILKEPQ